MDFSHQGIMEKETPQHIAIILDGNGRWAQARGKSRSAGHKAGADAVERTIKAMSNLGIKHLTLYAFSIENWRRSEEEISNLMGLLNNFLKNKRKIIKRENLRLNAIGRLEMLPESSQKLLAEIMEESKENSRGTLTLALSYGGRTELVDATKKIAEQVKSGELAIDAIDETVIQQNLYTHDLPDPDIMIRTSGEVRLSNFLLWQLSYTEFFFTNTLWPDFSESELKDIIDQYMRRERRYGGVINNA